MSEWTDMSPTFTAKTARKRGVQNRDLYRWRDSGEIIELSRGVFRRSDAPAVTYPDVLAVAYRAPRAIVCGISAADIHELTDEIPSSVQIAVPNSDRPPQIQYPPTTVFRFEEASFGMGLSSVEAAPGEFVRIYDAERTVVDLMRLRHRFGEPIALTALNRYLRRRDAKPGRILELARRLDSYGPVQRALEVALAQ
jgi:predicted transcriptional regulator of viral defense system